MFFINADLHPIDTSKAKQARWVAFALLVGLFGGSVLAAL